jgi:hypothetical protein
LGPLGIKIPALTAVIESEYLGSFIKAGGATLKVYVGNPESRNELCAEVERIGRDHRYTCAKVDGAVTKLHMLPELVFAVARQIPWEESLHQFISSRLQRMGLKTTRTDLSCETTAFINDLNEHDVRKRCLDMISSEIYGDYRLSLDFRLAISALCQCTLNPGDYSESLAESLREWLMGTLRFTVSVRPARIYKKVSEATARDILVSIPIWLRKAGYAGLVIAVDISRVVQWKRASGLLYYTRSNALDAYEIQRQFIDEAEEMENLFIVLLAGKEFLFDDSKGLNSYEALRLRLIDDVYDRNRPNPFGSMVRLL